MKHEALGAALVLLVACGDTPAFTPPVDDGDGDGSTATTTSVTGHGPTGGSTGLDSTGSDSTGGTSSSGDAESEESSGSSGDAQPVPADSTPPLLTTSVIDLNGTYDARTHMLGELSCTPVRGGPEPYPGCARPFRLPSAPAALADLGALTFIARSDAEVHAAARGFVDDIEFLAHDHLTHSDLYAIRIRLGEDSAFWHEYLDVKDLVVDLGDPIEAGDVLGRPGDYHDLDHGTVSLGIIRHQETFVRLCPSRFADDAVRDEFEAAVDASTQAFGPLWSAPCLEPALACIDDHCDGPDSFVAVGGDIDRGRRRYENQCAMCHGDQGQGDTHDPIIGCSLCTDHAALAEYIDAEMPPAGAGCSGTCAEDVAAFIQWEFGR